MKTKLSKLFVEFFESEQASGVILILCTITSIITLLAFGNPEIIQSSKISILLSSLVAGTVGFLILNRETAKSVGTTKNA